MKPVRKPFFCSKECTNLLCNRVMTKSDREGTKRSGFNIPTHDYSTNCMKYKAPDDAP